MFYTSRLRYKIILIGFVLILIVAGISYFPVKELYKSKQLDLRKVEATYTLRLIDQNVTERYRNFQTDVIEHASILARLMEDDKPQFLYRSVSLLRSFGTLNLDVDQVRILDSSGQERVRLENTDGQFFLTNTSSLQNKSNRDYFIKGWGLNNGESYISSAELNRENGKIEVPHHPVIRIASPIYCKGHKAFLLVVNYDFDGVLNLVSNSSWDQDWDNYVRVSEGLYSMVGQGHWKFTPKEKDRKIAAILADTGSFKDQEFYKVSSDTGGLYLFISQINENDLATESRQRDMIFEHALVLHESSVDAYARRQMVTNLPTVITFSVLALFLIYIIGVQWENRVELRKSIEAKNTELKEQIKTSQTILAIMGHDLRSPIASAISATALLMNKDVPMEEHERYLMLERLNKNATSALTLVEDLLAWARSRTDNKSTHFESISVAEIFKDSLSPYKNLIQSKNITVRKEFANDLVVYADKNMIKTAIRNLISNAAKYCSEGDEIILSSGTDELQRVYLVVEDTGHGMTKQQLNALRESAEMRSTMGTQGETGTGFGLVLIRDFVNKNHGELEIESEQGKGSRFTVYLPAG